VPLPARHAGILDRPAESVSQAGVRRGQALPLLLQRRLALGAGDADRAAHGAQAGGAFRRRLFRLEEGRRPGRGTGRRQGLVSSDSRRLTFPAMMNPIARICLPPGFFCSMMASSRAGTRMTLKLIIGNKNYSSWSFRPWIAMKVAGIPFEERVISLDDPQFKGVVMEISPAGQ